MAIPDALSRAHVIEYGPESIDPMKDFLGSLFNVANTHENNINECLVKQKDLYQEADLPLKQDVFGDAGEVRLLIFPNLVERVESNKQLVVPEVDNILAREQRNDPYWSEIISYIQDGLLPKFRSRAAFVRSISKQYIIDNNGILRKSMHLGNKEKINENDMYLPAILPAALYDETLKQLHEEPHAGHRKYKKLLEIVRDRYYFPNMAAIIKRYCELCEICQTTTIKAKYNEPLHPFQASYPGITVHIDCTPGPKVS